MNLLYTIKKILEYINHDELLRTMGYHNLKIGQHSLQKFLKTDDIYLFIKNGHYDLRYNSDAFLQHLLKSLHLLTVGNHEITELKQDFGLLFNPIF